MTVKMKLCRKCRAEKPESDFFPERKGYKVRFCYDCAEANMKKWASGRNVGRMPDEIKEIRD